MTLKKNTTGMFMFILFRIDVRTSIWFCKQNRSDQSNNRNFFSHTCHKILRFSYKYYSEIPLNIKTFVPRKNLFTKKPINIFIKKIEYKILAIEQNRTNDHVIYSSGKSYPQCVQ